MNHKVRIEKSLPQISFWFRFWRCHKSLRSIGDVHLSGFLVVDMSRKTSLFGDDDGPAPSSNLKVNKQFARTYVQQRRERDLSRHGKK